MAFVFFYIIAIPLAILAKKVDLRTSNVLLYIILLLYIFIFGFGYKLGVDWVIYETKISFPDEGPAHELGYAALTQIWRMLDLEFWLLPPLIKIFYILTLIPILKSFKNNSGLAFVCITLIAPMFFIDFLRQLIAAGFVNIAVTRLIKEGSPRYTSAFATIIIGALFHITALCATPLLALTRLPKLNFVLFFLILVFFLFSLIGLQPIPAVIQVAAEAGLKGAFYNKLLLYASVERSPMTIGHIARLALLSLALFAALRNKNLLLTPKNALLFSSFSLAIAYEFIFYDIETLWTRLREYFVFSIPAIFLVFFPNVLLFKNIRSLLCITYSAYAFSNFALSDHFYNYTSYRNILGYLVHQDTAFDSERQAEVRRHWENWKPRGIRE